MHNVIFFFILGPSILKFITIDLIITFSSVAAVTFITCIVAYIYWSKKFKGKVNCIYAENWKDSSKHISWTLITIVFFLVDLASDINIIYVYWRESSIDNFILSLIFTGLPVFANVLALTTIMVTRENKDPLEMKIFLFCIFLSPLLQLFVLTIVLARGPEEDEETGDLVRLASLLGLIETTFESAPQIIVQIYINIGSTEEEETSTKYIRYFALAGSALGIAKSMYNFKHDVEKGDTGKLTLPTKIVSFLSRIAEIGPRVMLLALLVSEIGMYSAICFAVHIAITFVIAITASCKNRVLDKDQTRREKMLLLLGSFANIFFFCKYKLFENVEKSNKNKLTATFYIFYYIENIAIVVFWCIVTNGKGAWYFYGIIALTVSGLILHAFFLFLFHRLKESQRKYRPDEQYELSTISGQDGL